MLINDLVCCVMLLSRVCALTGSLFLCVRCGLSMPVHSDEAVIQNGFGAGDGPPSLIISCVLDQCRLRVAPKHHLDVDYRSKLAEVLIEFGDVVELPGDFADL